MINIFITKIDILYKECEKMKKSTQYTISIITGLLLLAFGIIDTITNLTSKVISLIFINAGIIIIVVGLIRINQLGNGLTHDERTRKLGARAVSFSWTITFVAVNLFYWINYFKVVDLNLSQVLGLLFFIMILSASLRYVELRYFDYFSL